MTWTIVGGVCVLVALILVLGVGLGGGLAASRNAAGVRQGTALADALALTPTSAARGNVPAWFSGDVNGVPCAVACLRTREGSGTYSRHMTHQRCRVLVPLANSTRTVAYRNTQASAGDAFDARFSGEHLADVPAPAQQEMMRFLDQQGYLWLSPRDRGAQVGLSRQVFPNAPAFLMHSMDATSSGEDIDPDTVRDAVQGMAQVAQALGGTP